MILCDAGILLCLVDRTQPQHRAYKSEILRLTTLLVTTWSCLTEAMYLALHRGGWQMQKQLRQFLLDKLLIVYDIQESDYSRLLVLMEKYRDRPLIQLPRKFKEPPSGSLTMIAFQNQKSVGG